MGALASRAGSDGRRRSRAAAATRAGEDGAWCRCGEGRTRRAAGPSTRSLVDFRDARDGLAVMAVHESLAHG